MVKNYKDNELGRENLYKRVTELTQSPFVTEGIKVLLERGSLPITLTYGTELLRVDMCKYHDLYTLEYSRA